MRAEVKNLMSQKIKLKAFNMQNINKRDRKKRNKIRQRKAVPEIERQENRREKIKKVQKIPRMETFEFPY